MKSLHAGFFPSWGNLDRRGRHARGQMASDPFGCGVGVKERADAMERKFPAGKEPLGKGSFHFACHSGLECFNTCCRKLEMILYPYDILRLKRRLGISSEEFLHRYVHLGKGPHPFFPAVMMRMTDDEAQTCPFLGQDGCTVYADRPTSCRLYPLERAVDRTPVKGRPEEYYFLVKHPYCLGHQEGEEMTVKSWLRSQQLLYDNAMNDLWAEVDTLFAGNPWQGEGAGGQRQQLAFMACYNIDGFRQFVEEQNLLQRFRLEKSRLRLITSGDDEALLKFGFDWLHHFLAGRPTLRPR